MMFENQIKKQVRRASPTKNMKSVRQSSPSKLNQSKMYTAQSAQLLASSPRRSPGRKSSPKKMRGIGYANHFDPEVNRAIARELYVDSTVNVVNPGAKSTSKVVPGRMNLFNPKGQKNLAVSVSKRSLEEIKQENDEEFENSKISHIQGIYNDEGGRSKMRNLDL